MTRRLTFSLLFVFLLVTRLCHSGLLWVEESYPLAGAIQILHGKVPYRDFWYDKPPLAPYFYALLGAPTGMWLRVAGGLFVLLACVGAWRWGRALWGEREGLLAAGLFAVFLAVGIPGALLGLWPGRLLLVPHLLAIT